MNAKKLRLLFALAEEIYHDEQRKPGVIDPMPFCWAHNSDTGQLVVYSSWGVSSRIIAKAVSRAFPGSSIGLPEKENQEP